MVPPHIHGENIDEQAIKTLKKHFKKYLASCDPDFLLSWWDWTIDQDNLTLNLLRASRVNPQLSEHEYLFG